jgi:hypothetical protein
MSESRARRVHLIAIGVTLLISAAYLVVPTYATSSGSQTVIAVNGWWVALLLLLPVAIASSPLGVRGAGIAIAIRWAALLLTVFAVVTGFTIGTPYLLPAALLWAAAFRRTGESARDDTWTSSSTT